MMWWLLLRFGSLAVVSALVVLFSLRNNNSGLVSPSWLEERGRNLEATPVPSTRSLWYFDPRSVLLKNSGQTSNLASMRIAAFGTSKTWGAGLENPQTSAYVKLLSPYSVNLGLRATPADYPSLCLNSLIGDDTYDVIILEFSPNRGHHPDFERLAQRIRARFPYAIIIYLPIFMLLNDVDFENGPLANYLYSVRVPDPKDPSFNATILRLRNESLAYPSPASVLDKYKETVASIRGHVVEFPEYQSDIKKLVMENAKYYGSKQHPWDFVHPNELGHQLIAHKIREKVVEAFAEEPRHHGWTNPWMDGKDQCSSWLLNGNLTGDDVMDIKNMALKKFNERDGKWALEVDQMGGSFNVECQFANCNIYLSHMAVGPNRHYPRVLVSVNNSEPRLIDPLLHNFHLTQISLVGTLQQPGIATVTVNPIPEDIHSNLHFRITGVIRTCILTANPFVVVH